MHKLIFASAARTAATYNSPPIASEGLKGGKFYLNITNLTGTLDFKVQSLDEVSGTWIDVPGGSIAQQSATGIDELVIYPGVAETANVSVSDILGSPFRVVATVATGPITFSAGVWLVQ